MYLFKTSGKTFDGVIRHQKHAFSHKPRAYFGEIALISKNKVDCSKNEKQIQYIMEIEQIRPLRPGESEKYWSGTEGRWKYLVIGRNMKQISKPFNLEEVIGDRARLYGPVVTFKKVELEDEKRICDYLHRVGFV